MRRLTAVTLALLGATLVPATFAAAATPSLAGEVLFLTEQVQLTRSCNTTGTSTISYSVPGLALGPYPGTFTESGTLTIGPQNQPGSLFVNTAGPITSFRAQFTIDSPLGTITGTKTLPVQDPTDQGACVVAPTAILDIGFGPELCTDVDDAAAHIPTARYDATIQTATETQHDSGGSVVNVSELRANCVEFSPNQTGFDEEFYAVQPVNTPGHATGGGTIGAAPLAGVAFGFQADSTGDTFKGDCTVIDHDTGTMVKCVDVTGFVQTGNAVEITGDADVNGVGTTYRIVADDNGEPNQGVDDFSIQTGTGYSVGGPATAGNVQVH